MKTGKYKYSHELQLAGYALAFESRYEIPIDFGYLCYVNVDEKEVKSNCKLIQISNSLRSELRDKALEIMDNVIDPGIANDCEKECPYYKLCHPSWLGRSACSLFLLCGNFLGKRSKINSKSYIELKASCKLKNSAKHSIYFLIPPSR
jgi:hypothetical protein